MTLLLQAEYKVLHAEPADSRGIRHTLLQDRTGKLQYLASYHHPSTGFQRAVATDPPLCKRAVLRKPPSLVQDEGVPGKKKGKGEDETIDEERPEAGRKGKKGLARPGGAVPLIKKR
jgi:hypothetical protein